MSYIFITCETNGDVGHILRETFFPFSEKLIGLNASDYGTEIDSISIVMLCATQDFIDSGWLKERRYISWKNRFADIRLQIDYARFFHANERTRQLLVAKNIVDSIRVIEARSRKGFKGEKLRTDILGLIGLSIDEVGAV
ncbi:MAG: Imm44 family immunity protein [Defluviitaleaceae bacterium]|nr:Imm44 family immunity protein [Defluviitaleaceae bacterium]